MRNNKNKFTLKSDKYKGQLMPIKRQLMKEIASYFTDGKFEMHKETVLFYELTFSTFNACFDMIEGNENKFKLYLKAQEFMTVMRFDANEDVTVREDIPFLMKLLDYIDMDYREKQQ